MNQDEFRQHGHALVDWIADYLEHPERYPVLRGVKPGDVRAALPAHAPEQGEPFDAIFADFERVIVPGTHALEPSRVLRLLRDHRQRARRPRRVPVGGAERAGMLWRTSPSATELEEVVLGWLRQLLGLPTPFEGVIYDTASVSTLHALAAAREAAVPGVRAQGLPAGRAAALRVYCSDQAHSSIDKAVILLGLGHDALRKIPSDARLPDARRPRCATPSRKIAPQTSSRSPSSPPSARRPRPASTRCPTSPRSARAKACGCTWTPPMPAWRRSCPSTRACSSAWDRADSVVVNPHKWLFTPFDLSAFFCRRMDVLRQAFSLVPEYLRTPEAGAATNLMDTGVQLGRRFRALKLWMVLRYFGAEGFRARLPEHIRLAHLFARLGGRRRRLRAPRAGPLQRRLLPRAATRCAGATNWIASMNGCSTP